MKPFLLIISLLIFVIRFSFCQTPSENQYSIEQQYEQLASSGEAEIDMSELTENYETLIKHPLNINKARGDELMASNLMTSFQVNNLILHRAEFGKLLTIAELQVVAGFDAGFIRSIAPFITVDRNVSNPNATFGRMLKEGSHSIISRVQWTQEKKRGFKKENGITKYAGDPFAIYCRYRFSFMKKLSVALIAEKDAGEEFFTGSQKRGFDFYSGHVALRDAGMINIFVAGDYQLEYGQGLTLWSGLSSGSSPDPSIVIKNGPGINPSTSSNEAFYKRGVATSLMLKKIHLDIFYSHKKIDANMNNYEEEGTEIESFTSIQTSGYHRTESELEDKNSIVENLYGSHVSFKNKNLLLGFTIVNTAFNSAFDKTFQPYNQFNFKGKSITNTGLDYKWLFQNINVYGEVSRSQQGGLALVNGVTITADPRLYFSVLYRNYSTKYQNLSSASFRESGSSSNEEGIYSSFTYKISRTVQLVCSYDYFYFKWLKYRTDAPSDGFALQSVLTYKPLRNSEMYFRFRVSETMENGSELLGKINSPVKVNKRGMRFHVTTKISKSFSLRSRVETVLYLKESKVERGVVVFQDIQYHPMGIPLSWNFRYALFDTDSYESRIYAYENDVLYAYSIPAYYYKGVRFYFNTRIKIKKGFDVWFRYAVTFYSNRKIIGSGWDEIQGNRKTDLKIQICKTFK